MDLLLAEWPRLLALLIVLLVSGIFSGAETAFFSLTRSQVRCIERESDVLGAFVVRLARRPRRLLVTILLGNIVSNVAFFSTVLVLAGRASRMGAVLTGAGAFLVLILLGEFIPKGVALHHPVRFARVTAGPVFLFQQAILPVLFLLDRLVEVATRLVGGRRLSGPDVSAEDLKTFVRLSGAAGRLDIEEREMLRDVIDLREIRVKEVMVPRVDLVAVEQGRGREAVIEAARRHHMSKVVIYERSIDEVRGYVAVKDLLYEPDQPLDVLVRKIRAVPETKTTESLLGEFRGNREPLVLVVDEYGGTAGIATPEDLVEEVVGELGDEYDPEERSVRPVARNVDLVAGELTLREWEEYSGVTLPPGRYDTLGGFFVSTLDRMPVLGESVSAAGIRFTVLRVRGGRVLSLLADRTGKGARE